MKEIPQNCIDTFVGKFGSYPSVVELSPLLSSEDMNSFLNKYTLESNPELIDLDLPELKKLQNIQKTISIDEFQRLGYLQELNRRFLHLLGLSMVIIVDDKTGEKSFYHIGDFREEGICFDESVIETKEFNDRKSFIDEEFMKRTKND